MGWLVVKQQGIETAMFVFFRLIGYGSLSQQHILDLLSLSWDLEIAFNYVRYSSIPTSTV